MSLIFQFLHSDKHKKQNIWIWFCLPVATTTKCMTTNDKRMLCSCCSVLYKYVCVERIFENATRRQVFGRAHGNAHKRHSIYRNSFSAFSLRFLHTINRWNCVCAPVVLRIRIVLEGEWIQRTQYQIIIKIKQFFSSCCCYCCQSDVLFFRYRLIYTMRNNFEILSCHANNANACVWNFKMKLWRCAIYLLEIFRNRNLRSTMVNKCSISNQCLQSI